MNPQLIDWQQVFRASAALQSVAETSNEGTPSPGSQAAKEMANFANPAVLEEAHAHGTRSLVYACDHAFALNRAIAEPVLSVAPWACARQVLELGSLCIWMLDTQIGPVDRATRGLNVRLEGICRSLVYFRKLRQRNPSTKVAIDQAIQYAENRINYLKSQAQALGIKERFDRKTGKRFQGFGDKSTSITERIESAFPDAIDYALLSAAAHGDSWAILALSIEVVSDNPPSGMTGLRPEYAVWLVTNALQAIALCLWTQYRLYGWDEGQLGAVLDTAYDQAGLKPQTRFWRQPPKS